MTLTTIVFLSLDRFSRPGFFSGLFLRKNFNFAQKSDGKGALIPQ